MSSLSKNANGSWRLRFADKFGGETRRGKITLPKSPKHVAEAVAVRVDALIASRVAGVQVDHKTLTWLGEVDDELYGRLERACLVRPRQSAANAKATLGYLVEQWQVANTHHKPNTIRNNRQTGEKLLKHIGSATPVAGLTVSDAKRYVDALQKTRSAKGKPPAPAAIAREIKRARQVFTHAVDNGMIEANPSRVSRQDRRRTPNASISSPSMWLARCSRRAPTANGG